MSVFYAILPANSFPLITQQPGKALWTHIATHRIEKKLLLLVNEIEADSFLNIACDESIQPQVEIIAGDAAKPVDFLSHWERILSPSEPVDNVQDNFVERSNNLFEEE